LEKIGENRSAELGHIISLIYDRVRWEEKILLEELKARDIETKFIDAKLLILDHQQSAKGIRQDFGDAVLQRCISHFRGLHVAAFLEGKNLRVVNAYRTGENCGNKLLTTSLLIKAGVPTPRTKICFSQESALEAIEDLGYPVVLKPVVGSWGRLVIAIKNREMARSVIEMRGQMEGLLSQIYYLQEMVKRPPRDIRCIVAGDNVVTAVYRYAPPDDWRTNVAVGGKTGPCPITVELRENVLRAAEAVGGGVLGVDLMEGPEGLVVHEVNNTVEFRGATTASSTNIPKAIIDYVVDFAAK
jgi:[lysine-biosynthesis-protein LysW]--L-2-aminoadipate ligase